LCKILIMPYITHHELEQWDKIPRLNLINSIAGFKSAFLIGTRSLASVNNLAVFSSVVHLGSHPPTLGFVLRPTHVPRHTYQNLLDRRECTLNLIVQGMEKAAHQSSAAYSAEESEFDAVGLTPMMLDYIDVPFVAESPLRMLCKMVDDIPIPHNQTRLIVLSIEYIDLPDSAIGPDGFVNLSALNALCIGGLDTYLKPEPIARYAYARPHQPLRELDL